MKIECDAMVEMCDGVVFVIDVYWFECGGLFFMLVQCMFYDKFHNVFYLHVATIDFVGMVEVGYVVVV